MVDDLGNGCRDADEKVGQNFEVSKESWLINRLLKKCYTFTTKLNVCSKYQEKWALLIWNWSKQNKNQSAVNIT